MTVPAASRARWIAVVLAAACVQAAYAQQPAVKTATVQRLYAITCGEAKVPDLSPWSPGFNVGKAAVFSDNCYLIVHGNDLMMWDSGYPDAFINTPDGVVGPRSTAYVKKTLVSQLAEIGVKPAQVTRIAFSHTHGDHVGERKSVYVGDTVYSAA